MYHEKISLCAKCKSFVQKLLIELMKGNISKKELMAQTGIGDKGTVELKIEELVALKPQLKPLYDEYISKKSENFYGYQFRAEAIEMLRKDASQSTMAEMLGIARRTFSSKMKKLQEKNIDNILGILLREHATRKEKKIPVSDEVLLLINLQLDEYEQQYPVGTSRYEKRNPLEVKRENLQRVVSLIDSLRQEGVTLKELEERKVISEANYRRYRLELDALNQIEEGNQEKEQ
jgi:hypothetical protein